jgi:broad specificity phosphatase PhoE
MKCYFVRHGESEANLLNEFSSRSVNHGLTPKGKRKVGLYPPGALEKERYCVVAFKPFGLRGAG